MGGPSRPPRAPSAHHVVGPSRTDRGWLGSPRRSIPPTPLTSVPTQPDPEARDTRGAPKPTWRATHRTEHVRQEAGPSERRSHEFGPISNRQPWRLLHSRRLRSQSPPQPPPRHTHAATPAALHSRLPEPASALLTVKSRGQTPRDLPLVARDFPQAWRPRTRPGLRSGPPPLRGARARPLGSRPSGRVRARRASHLCELHHGGG